MQKFRPPQQAEFWTDERIYMTELLNHPDEPQVSLAVGRVEAGVTTQLHSLSVDERYVVKSGRALMEVDGKPAFEIGPGDCVRIPAHSSQRCTNIGEEDFIIYCVCTPRFTPACYKDLEAST